MNRVLALILLLALLAGCATGPNILDESTTAAPPSEEEAFSALEESSIPQPEEEPPAGLSGWEKPTKPTPEEIADPAYWVPVQRYLRSCYRDTFDRDDAMGQGYFSHFLLENQFARLRIRPAENIITFDQYVELVVLFYGPKTADALMEEARGGARPAYLDPETETFQIDVLPLDTLNDDRFQIDSAEPLSGTDEVRLTVTMFWSARDGDPYQTLTYDLFWDEWAGYLPQKISWEYVPTQVVRVDADAAEPWAKPLLFDELWGRPAHKAYDYRNYMGLKYNKTNIVGIGQTAYRFYTEGPVLLADALDLDSMLQQTELSVFKMKEDILGFFPDSQGVTLYTVNEAVRLGSSLEQIAGASIPAGVNLEEIQQLVFQQDLTHMAYWAEEGLFLCPLGENAQPTLLREHWKGENVTEYHSFYPIAFLEGERLYVAASVWEASAGFYLLLDYERNELARLDYHTSGEHSGGYHSLSPAWVHYNGWTQAGWADWRAYSFETGVEEGAEWMGEPYQAQWNDLFVPGKPNQWVISMPDDYFDAEISIFALADFEKKTLEALPLTIHNAQAGVLAVAPSGHVLFVYSYRGEGGYGVFRLWQPDSEG